MTESSTPRTDAIFRQHPVDARGASSEWAARDIALADHAQRLERELAEANAALSEVRGDADLWRKFCGLVAFGDFVVYDHSDDDAGDVPAVEYGRDLRAAVESCNDLHAECGHKDEARIHEERAQK